MLASRYLCIMLIDITRPVQQGIPVWPGDAPFHCLWTLRQADGASVNLAELRLSAHTGTHADGPFHADSAGATIGAAPPDLYIGHATLVDAPPGKVIPERWVAELLSQQAVERLLVRTGCWADPQVFPEEFPVLEPAAAARLTAAGVMLFGTDAPSVDAFHSRDLPVHHRLGEGGVAILENLLLDDVNPGSYELIALPLRVMDADSSPVRAVLRPL